MANPNLWWVFIRSISIIFSIAFCIAICIGFIFKSFISGILAFIMSVIAQFAINSIVNTYSDKKNKEAEFLAAQVLKEASERQMPYNLNCAYCNKLNRVGISFNAENTFNCIDCKQPNKVYIQFTTVRLTVPLSQSNSNSQYIDMGDEDSGVSQSTINNPIKVNEP